MKEEKEGMPCARGWKGEGALGACNAAEFNKGKPFWKTFSEKEAKTP